MQGKKYKKVFFVGVAVLFCLSACGKRNVEKAEHAKEMTELGSIANIAISSNGKEEAYTAETSVHNQTFDFGAFSESAVMQDDYDDIENLYIPVVEGILSETFSSAPKGLLFDLDNDGVRELITLASYPSLSEYNYPGVACSVYDVEDGKAVTRLDKSILYSLAGGPDGSVYIVEYMDEIALMIYIDNGETGYGAERNVVRTIYDAESLRAKVSIEICYKENEDDNPACWIDGVECTGDTVAEILSEIDIVAELDDVDNRDCDDGIFLFDLLQSMQKNISLEATQQPVITQCEARNVFCEEYSHFLEDEEYRFTECGTLIKDGVEYYYFCKC